MKEELIALLNNGDSSERTGKEVCELLGRYFNCFGSYQNMLEALNNSLSKKGRSRLLAMICFAAMKYSHDRSVFGETYDLRNKASQSFAYKNIGFFEEEFYDSCGFTPTLFRDDRDRSYTGVLSPKEFKENGCNYLLGFIHKWNNEHPTIQQAIFGGYTKGILVKNSKYKWAPPLDYCEVAFPFI